MKSRPHLTSPHLTSLHFTSPHLQVATSGYKWFDGVKSGAMWFYVVKWFYVAKWLYVDLISGFMWLIVGKWQKW